MKKCRIVERTLASRKIVYVIQRKHPIFRFFWVDASFIIDYEDTFQSLDEAKDNLKYFDGSDGREKVVWESK